ncbi:hypothetical protein K9N68_37120 (plasmid) [Kovacikia minuta CCNUW1]|uniref:hypothetical protein n=1 Tax=Kovacikia minuta TaxID=2931930 RepID=UPI001CCAB764|nr:hypothetical protein [Kovacikia minuta]UBF29834.1 hypothetical protein K9N68_37120 [Kovacikia minuta CCNUW1]
MKPFFLLRHKDISGVSGTGNVAQGCLMSSGKVLLSWHSNHPSGSMHESFGAVQATHGHGGATEIVFESDKPDEDFPVLYILNHRKEAVVKLVAEIVHFKSGWVGMQWLINPYGIEFFGSMKAFLEIQNSKDYTSMTLIR